MPISQKYTMSSKLDDIKSEFLNLKSQRELQNSVKYQRKMMLAVVTGVELNNTKFASFAKKISKGNKLKINGLSTKTLTTIESE